MCRRTSARVASAVSAPLAAQFRAVDLDVIAATLVADKIEQSLSPLAALVPLARVALAHCRHACFALLPQLVGHDAQRLVVPHHPVFAVAPVAAPRGALFLVVCVQPKFRSIPDDFTAVDWIADQGVDGGPHPSRVFALAVRSVVRALPMLAGRGDIVVVQRDCDGAVAHAVGVHLKDAPHDLGLRGNDHLCAVVAALLVRVAVWLAARAKSVFVALSQRGVHATCDFDALGFRAPALDGKDDFPVIRARIDAVP
jgi:hypothetical protein